MDTKFHPAIAAIKSGDVDGLKSLVSQDPSLATTRSSRSHPTLLQCLVLDSPFGDPLTSNLAKPIKKELQAKIDG